jgi:hypothetical protein
MTTPPPAHGAAPDPGYNYTVLCLFALVVMTSILLQTGIGLWGLLPAAVGLVAVYTHWRAGPPLVLVSLACLLGMHRAGMDMPVLLLSLLGRVGRLFNFPNQRVPLPQGAWAWQDDGVGTDVVLCTAVLAYTAAHYRLLSLVNHAFPPDPRRRERPPAPPGGGRRPAGRVVEQPRSPATAVPAELVLLLGGLPLWAGTAALLWDRLTADEPAVPPRPGESDVWLAMVLIWVVGLIVVLTTVLLRYLGQYQTTVEENRLYLQDQVWRETRREQSRLNRWLVWARRRGQRRKEGQ